MDDTPTTSDERRLREISDRLAEVIASAVGPWARAQLRARLGSRADEPALAVELEAAVGRFAADATGRVQALLAADIDAQRSTPLSLLRSSSALLHPVLEAAGVPDAPRDALDRARDPDDRWALAPVTWADLGSEVGEAGIVWGAAKAHVHLARRRAAAADSGRSQAPGGES